MTDTRDLIEKMRKSPNNIRFEEYRKALLSFGFEMSRPRSGSSHVTFRHPLLRTIITVKQEAVVKKGYVRLALDALDELGGLLE